MSSLIDLEAERTCLGAVLRDNAALSEMEAVLTVRHFHDAGHRTVFAAMQAMRESGRQIDYMTLRDELGAQLDGLGGVSYLTALDDGLPRVSNPVEWARIVREKAKRRALVVMAEEAIRKAQADGDATEQLVEDLHGELARLMDAEERGIRHVGDLVPGAFKALEDYAMSRDGLTGRSTGFPKFDQMTGGLRPGTLDIIAARPSRGKSVFCMQVALHAAEKGARVLVFSMEMSPESITQRMLLSESRVSRWDLRRNLGGSPWEEISRQFSRLSDLPIWFDGREAPTLAQIRSACRQQKQRLGLDVVVVDYLQRCSLDARQDRWVAVGDLAKGLKNLALSLGVPVLAACQTNADTEEKRPTLADLAQARQVISAEADVVAFLHPKEPGRWRDQDLPVVQLLVDKVRDGATGPVDLLFDRPCLRFSEA